jgi:16S rRNA processing protein RimM
VKARLHWAESRALFEARRVLVSVPQAEPRWFRIESANVAQQGMLLKLAGVDTRESAETLRGAALALTRDELPALEEGEFYLCDLVGATVLVAGQIYGEVIEVRTHPTLDTVVVRTADGSLVEQPLTSPWLVRVDSAAREIELANTYGIIV